MKMIMKLLFLLVGTSAIIFIYKEELLKLKDNQSKSEIISSAFEDDMKFLKERKFLPAIWDDLKEVSYTGSTPAASQWLAESKPFIKLKPDGKYQLEYILIDDNDAALVQLNITDIQSGNKVWELNRVYPLGDNTITHNND